MRTIEELEEELKQRRLQAAIYMEDSCKAVISKTGTYNMASARGTTICGALSEALTRYQADFPEG